MMFRKIHNPFRLALYFDRVASSELIKIKIKKTFRVLISQVHLIKSKQGGIKINVTIQMC